MLSLNDFDETETGFDIAWTYTRSIGSFFRS